MINNNEEIQQIIEQNWVQNKEILIILVIVMYNVKYYTVLHNCNGKEHKLSLNKYDSKVFNEAFSILTNKVVWNCAVICIQWDKILLYLFRSSFNS